MSKDIRIALGFWEHWKTVKVKRILGVEGIESLMRLWDFAAQFHTKGILEGMDIDEIEIAAKWNGERGKFVTTMADDKIRFLDKNNGFFMLHDWEEHQGFIFYSEERSKKAKKAVSVRIAGQKDKSKRSSERSSERSSPSPSPSPKKDISFVSEKIETNSLLSGGLTAGVGNVTPQVSPIVPEAPKKKKGERKKIIYSEGFEEFWKVYPKLTGKAAAFEEWEKIPNKHEGVTARKIVNAIIAQVKAKHFTHDDGKDYTPLPATWLHQGRWDDGIKVPQTQERKGSARLI